VASHASAFASISTTNLTFEEERTVGQAAQGGASQNGRPMNLVLDAVQCCAAHEVGVWTMRPRFRELTFLNGLKGRRVGHSVRDELALVQKTLPPFGQGCKKHAESANQKTGRGLNEELIK
jgi:hypothetical protein